MHPFAMLMAAADTGGTGSPSGPPTNGSTYYISGSFVGVQWTNGDATASTQVWFRDTVTNGCPSAVPDDLTYLGSASPGQTTFEPLPKKTDTCTYYIRHGKNAAFSAFLQITSGVTSCTVCPTV